MAQAPMLAPTAPPAGGMMGGDPMAGAAPDAGTDTGGDVVVTICSNGDGSYTVYAGYEPDAGAGDAGMSDDDMAAMGPAGAAPAPNGGASASEGQPADSIGAALKAALDIMQADAASSGGTSPEDNFSSGFGASGAAKASVPVGQKY